MKTIMVQTCFAEGREKYREVETESKFSTCIIDPAWPYTVAPGMKNVEDIEDKESKGRLFGFTSNKDETKNKYKKSSMTIDELSQLPISDLVGGYVLLWAVGPFIVNGEAMGLLNKWGFTPLSILTWAKFDVDRKAGYGGVGYWFLGNAEFCIVSKRVGWPSIRTGRSSLIVEKKTKHSEKPENVHVLCEQRFPGPYLEVFGRKKREGWTVIGNDVDGMDIMDSINGINGKNN